MSPTLRLQFLGKFSLIYGDAPITSLNTPRLQSLLAYLVLHRDAAQPRRQIAFCLWPDFQAERARANLRKLFYQLRHALPDAARFLRADKFNVHWQPTISYQSDVVEFEAQASQTTSRGQALTLCGGVLSSTIDQLTRRVHPL